MTQPAITLDVVGIGNALVDVLSHENDQFLTDHDLVKGSMALVDTDRAGSLYDDMGPAIVDVMSAIAAQGLTSAGSVFSHPLRMDPDTFDFEVGVPVITPVSATGRVKGSQLRAATVARTVYHGSYEVLASAWSEFDAWIISQGHKSAPALWGNYVAGPESNANPATWRTELNLPLSAR